MKLFILLLVVLLGMPNGFADNSRTVTLTGWGIDGKNPEKFIAEAEAVGFDELITTSNDPAFLKRAVEAGRMHHMKIFSCLSPMAGLEAFWSKRYPERPVPWQVMTDEQEAARTFIAAGKNKYLTPYQFGGEPRMTNEVLLTKIICLSNPEARELFKPLIDGIVSVPGIEGVALDGFGYQNYHRCHCEHCQKMLEEFSARPRRTSLTSARRENSAVKQLRDFHEPPVAFRLLRGDGLLCVGVDPLAGLHAEVARLHQILDGRRQIVTGTEAGGQLLVESAPDIEPAEVADLKGADGSQAETKRSRDRHVNLFRTGDAPPPQIPHLAHHRRLHAIDDKARDFLPHRNGGFPDTGCQVEGCRKSFRGGLQAGDHFDHGHEVRRVEPVHVHAAARMRETGGDLRHRERRCVAGKDCC